MRRHARVLFAVAALASFFAFAAVASAEYEYAGTFGSEGSGDGQLAAKPGRAALEPSTGNLFVVDAGNNRVEVFKPNASKGADYLTQFGAGQLSSPYGIAIDQQAGQTSVYVADAGNNRIVKYESDEAATPSFTLDGSFSLTAGKVGDYKAALAVDPASHDLLVGDPGNALVERFGANGAFMSSFDGSAGAGSPGKFSAVEDIAVNSGGDVYVVGRIEGVDTITAQALRFSGTGSYKAALYPVGPYDRPGTVSVNPGNDEVVVSGNQGAVERLESPTVHRFDSANAPLSSLSVELMAGAFQGLAAAPDRFYAVVDVADNAFGFPPAPRVDVFAEFHKPVVAVDPVSNLTVTSTSAKLTGSVNPNGLATEWHFEYSSDGGSTWSSTADQNLPAGSDPVAVSATVSGLAPETDHLFRLAASNSEGARTSGSESFRLTYVREVLTGGVTNQTATSATLHGAVNPGGTPLTGCEFEFGPSRAGLPPEYGETVPCAESLAAIGSGEAQVPVHADISGLIAGNYEFRLVAANAEGETPGGSAAMKVKAPPTFSPPSGSVVPLGDGSIGATVKVRVNPGNDQTAYRVEYGTTPGYGESTPDRQLRADTESKRVSVQVASLAPNTTYHFRFVAVNSAGTGESEDLVLTTGPGGAATACPNAEIRAAQGATRLPECRAYEMVSPLDKAGNDVRGEQISPDGNRVEFGSGGGLPGVGALSGVSHYRSARLGSDWSGALSLDPPQRANGQNLKYQQVMAISEDQSRAFVYSTMALAPGAEDGGANVYIRDLDANTYHLVASGDALENEYTTIGRPIFFEIEGNADFSRIFFDTALQLTPDAPELGEPGVGDKPLYEWSFADGLHLASYLPNGTPSRMERFAISPQLHYVAANALRNLYTIIGEAPGSPKGLYLREGDKVIQVSASQRTGDDRDVVHTMMYLGAAADLSIIYFRSPDNLTDQSHHVGEGIYRYDVNTKTLTDLTANFGSSKADTEMLGGISLPNSEVGVVTRDGEALYLSSMNDLSPGGGLGNFLSPPTYILRFTKNSIDRVATQTTMGTAWGINLRYTGTTSPNGRYFAYVSRGSDTDDNGSGASCNSENNLCQQIYLYDSVEKTLACVSCDPTGAPSRGDSSLAVYTYLEGGYRNVTDQGMIAFQSPNSLDPRDVNEHMDVYTWQDGNVNLISSGKGPDAYYNDMSEDGSSILFTTGQKLVGRDDDELADAYVARVDGGLASQNAVLAPAPCEGAECKGPATPAPTSQNAGTATFSGAGNAKPKPRCAKTGKRAAASAKSKQRCSQKKHQKKKKKKRGTGKRGAGR